MNHWGLHRTSSQAQRELGFEKDDTCTTIQDGTLLTSDNKVIVPGYDEFGYNYQAHLFNGRYCDYDRVIGGDYCDVNLVMKWNDAWVSNKDCDGDGKEHKWTWFAKIVAKPTANYDCAAQGGVQMWGDFCEIQSVYNDPYAGYHGLEFKAARPGLGNW